MGRTAQPRCAIFARRDCHRAAIPDEGSYVLRPRNGPWYLDGVHRCCVELGQALFRRNSTLFSALCRDPLRLSSWCMLAGWPPGSSRLCPLQWCRGPPGQRALPAFLNFRGGGAARFFWGTVTDTLRESVRRRNRKPAPRAVCLLCGKLTTGSIFGVRCEESST
jgi:hypothetical protein